MNKTCPIWAMAIRRSCLIDACVRRCCKTGCGLTARRGAPHPLARLTSHCAHRAGSPGTAPLILSPVIYDQAYNNDQTGSPRFRTHVAEMVERILARVSPDGVTHLAEVGCGQGALLAEFARRRAFASLTGFDPAWRGNDGVELQGVTIHRRYFGPDALDLVPHGPLCVVSRHTIEHVPDRLSFLCAIRATMKPGDGAHLFLETPDIEWIVENFQPQDLFYEHCSIFSATRCASRSPPLASRFCQSTVSSTVNI